MNFLGPGEKHIFRGLSSGHSATGTTPEHSHTWWQSCDERKRGIKTEDKTYKWEQKFGNFISGIKNFIFHQTQRHFF